MGFEHDFGMKASIFLTVVMLVFMPFVMFQAHAEMEEGAGYNTSAIHEVNINGDLSDETEVRAMDIHPSGDVLLTNSAGELWYGRLEGGNLTIMNKVTLPRDFEIDEISISPDGDKAALLLYYPDSCCPSNISIGIIYKISGEWERYTGVHEIYYNNPNYSKISGITWLNNDTLIFDEIFSLLPESNGIYTIDIHGKGISRYVKVNDPVTDIEVSPDGTVYFSENGDVYYVNRNTREMEEAPISASKFDFMEDYRIVHNGTWYSTELYMYSSDAGETLIVPSYSVYKPKGVSDHTLLGFKSVGDKVYFYFNLDFYFSSNRFVMYYVEDSSGEWKDSDGDGVWDGIDGAPDDPNEGYGYYHNVSSNSYDDILLSYCAIFVLIVIVVVAVFYKIAKTTRVKSKASDVYPSPSTSIGMEHRDVRAPDGNMEERCPFCGSPLVKKKGRKYCEKCKIYF